MPANILPSEEITQTIEVPAQCPRPRSLLTRVVAWIGNCADYYALVNRSDWGLAACFTVNAICCIAILGVAYWKRRRFAKRLGYSDQPTPCVAA
jgi:hypothetical protein